MNEWLFLTVVIAYNTNRISANFTKIRRMSWWMNSIVTQNIKGERIIASPFLTNWLTFKLDFFAI
jgi:hypothetical protein